MTYKRLSCYAIIVVFIFFLVYSARLDQLISVLPFDYVSRMFYGEISWWCNFIYFLVPCFTTLLIVVPVIVLFLKRNTTDIKKAKRLFVVVLMSLLIGPGLVINVGLKNHWGRPRPYQVLRDHQIFVPVWRPNLHKPENNSFCSGHAAIGFFLGVPLLAVGRRKAGLVVGCCGGAIIGLVRILQGGHYLSDIVFAGIFVWLISELVMKIVDKNFN